MTRRTRAKLTFLAPQLVTLDSRTAQPPLKVADPFYLSAAWRRLVGQLIAARGRICEGVGCGRTGVRLFGDHIRELQDDGARLDPANVQLLCGSCHSTKTAATRAARQARSYAPRT